MRQIKSFDEACQVLGYSNNLPDVSNAPEKHRKALLAHYQLVIIVEAINSGWQPNWADTDEYKYELWPDIIEDESKPSGFGLSSALTLAGVRLRLSARAFALGAAKQLDSVLILSFNCGKTIC
ncbi:hypothetical protein ACLOAU_14465 [Niabella sp. CJ426]|uniref:hypothetical protein n=1 Tax=Niabella sp. CJ426 TaxID=3393740 RepID=UPI003D07AA7D